MVKHFTLNITRTTDPGKSVDGTAGGPENEDEDGFESAGFGPDGIYCNLTPRLQAIADRLYYTNGRGTQGGPPNPNYEGDGKRVYGLTDFSFVTRPRWAGGGFDFSVWED